MRPLQLNFYYLLVLFVFFSFPLGFLNSQVLDAPEVEAATQKAALKAIAQKLNQSFLANKEKALAEAKIKGWHIVDEDTLEGYKAELVGIDSAGHPIYYGARNLAAAHTIGASKVWPGGGMLLSLTGAGLKLGEWDGGAVRLTHVELENRVVQKDGATTLSNHATHVAGTLIAAGVRAEAKGMAYQARLDAYDWNNDLAEMYQAAAEGLLISNHSYGLVLGWNQASRITDANGQTHNNVWTWNGNTAVSPTLDYLFGNYTQGSVYHDLLARLAPYYLIAFAAGNDRGEGPNAGAQHFVRNSQGRWVSSTVTRPKDGPWDIIDPISGSKNVLCVGAVDDLPSGYNPANPPSQVRMSSFSCWGPMDDGRIKPDVTANGVNLLSSSSANNTAYSSSSGTSMATPNAAGSLLLLQQHHKNLYGKFMRSATLKALAIHTADEAGSSPGPDYAFGWGLLNIAAAAQAISEKNRRVYIIEDSLFEGQTWEMKFNIPGNRPLKATLYWHDVPGVPPPRALNPTAKMLVNDLDLRLTLNNAPHLPWVLNPANPSAAATRGDNITDNVEQIFIANPSAGCVTLRVSHKGALAGGPYQHFSLIISDATPECNLAIQMQVGPQCPFGAGSLALNAAGGTPPYRYQWFPSHLPPNPRQEGISAGIYAVTVQDGAACCQRAAAVLVPKSNGAVSKRANVWNYGDNAALDFNTGFVNLPTYSDLSSEAGTASICDENGKLLLYSDGRKVWNGSHNLILRGDSLMGGNRKGTQTSIFVPHPGNPNRYFIFTVDSFASPRGLRYSEIDITLNNNQGAIISGRKNLLLRAPVAEKITAVQRPDGGAYWVIAHGWNNNEFYAYRVDSSGVQTTPVVSAIGALHNATPAKEGAVGYMKASPCGRRLACAIYKPGLVEIFDFNATTGAVTQKKATLNLGSQNRRPYGLEFSRSGDKLYYSALALSGIPRSYLYRVDLSLPSEAEIVASNQPFLASEDNYLALQLAPNGKIYATRIKGGNTPIDSLSVINYPENPISQIGFIRNAVSTNGNRQFFGLPTFVSSFLDTLAPRIRAINSLHLCRGRDTASLSATIVYKGLSYQWYHNGVAIAGQTNPLLLQATKAGEYRLAAANSEGCVAFSLPLEVTETPVPTVPSISLISLCEPLLSTFRISFEATQGQRYSLLAGTERNASVITQNNAPFFEVSPPSASVQWGARAINFTPEGKECASSIGVFSIAIQARPSPPQVSVGSLCGPGLANLSAFAPAPQTPHTALRLFERAQDVTPIFTSSSPLNYTLSVSSTRQVFVETYDSAKGCASDRIAASIIVHPLPLSPEASSWKRCGPGSIVFSLHPLSAQLKLKMFEDSSQAQSAPLRAIGANRYQTAEFTSSQIVYLAWQDTLTGCFSERKQQEIILHSLPPAPQVLPAKRCGAGSAVFGLSPPLPYRLKVSWDTLTQILPPYAESFSTPFINQNTNYSFRYEDSATGCVGEEAERTAEIIPLPEVPAPLENEIGRCGEGVVSIAFEPPIASLRLHIFENLSASAPYAALEDLPWRFQTPWLVASTTYYLKAEDIASGCFSDISPLRVRITQPAPEFSIAASAQTLCQTDTLKLSALPELRLPEAAYIWQTPGGEVFTTQEPRLSLSQPRLISGVYSLTVKNGKCIERKAESSFVTVNSAIPLPIVTAKKNYCQGDTLILEAAFHPLASYSWKGPAGFSAQGNRVRLAGLLPQHAGAYIAASTLAGCAPQLDTLKVEVESFPEEGILARQPLCYGTSLTLAAPWHPRASYLWQGPNGFTSTDSEVHFAFLDTLDQGAYTLEIGLAGCGLRRQTYSLELLNPPFTLPDSISVCENQLYTLAAPLRPQTQYRWQGPDWRETFSHQIEIMATSQNQGYYKLTTQAAGCLPSEYKVYLRASPLPGLPAFSQRFFCPGQLWKEELPWGPATEYQWSGPDGWFFEGPTPERALTSPSQSGVYSLIAKLGECVASSSFTLTLLGPEVTPFFSAPSAVCKGQSLKLSAYPNSADSLYFIWYNASGQIIKTGTENEYLTGPLEEVGNVTYSLQAVKQAQVSCTTAKATLTVAVNEPLLHLPQVTAQYPPCDNGIFLLKAPLNPLWQYRWEAPGGLIYNRNQWVFPRFNQTPKGVYTLSVTPPGCPTVRQEITIDALEPSLPNAINQEGGACWGASVRLYAQAQPYVNYLWQGPNGFSATTPSIFWPSLEPRHIGEYTLTIQHSGCPATRLSYVLTGPDALPTVAPVLRACAGGSVVLSVLNFNPQYAYLWEGPGGFVSTTPEPLLQNIGVENQGLYSLSLEAAGCSSFRQATELQVVTLQVPVIRAPEKVCGGEELAIAIENPQPSYFYRWQLPNGETVVQHRVYIERAQREHNGLFTLSYGIGSCQRVQIFSIQVIELPQVELAQRHSICLGQALALSAQPEPGVSYRWETPGGQTAEGWVYSKNRISFSDTGWYTLTATGANCRARASTKVEVLEMQAPILPTSLIYCPGHSALSISPSNIPLGSQVFWQTQGWGYEGESLDLSLIPKRAEAYSIQVFYKQGECASASAVFSLQPPPPLAPLSVSPSATVCQGQPFPWSNILQESGDYWIDPANRRWEAGFLPTNALVSYSGVWRFIRRASFCPDTTVFFLNVAPLPNEPKLAQSVYRACAGQPIILKPQDDSPGVLVWQTPLGVTIGDSLLLLSRAETIEGGVIRILGSCTSSVASFQAVYLEKPNLQFGSLASAYCQGEELNLTVFLSEERRVTQPLKLYYTINGGEKESLLQSGENKISLALSASGNFNLYFRRVEDSASICSWELGRIYTLQIQPIPELSITALPAKGCGPELGQIFWQEEAGVSYALFPSGGVYRTGSYSSLAPGRYRFLASTSAGCQRETEIEIPLDPLPLTPLTFRQEQGRLWVSYPSVSGAVAYEARFRRTDTPGAAWQVLPPTPNTSILLSSLEPSATYEFQARYSCDAQNFSDYTPSFSTRLTTNSNCGAAPLFTVTYNAGAPAIEWEPINGTVCMVLSYGPLHLPFEQWRTIVLPYTASFFKPTNLAPGVAYGARLRRNCSICSSTGGVLSPFSEVAPLQNNRVGEFIFSTRVEVRPNPSRGRFEIQMTEDQLLEKLSAYDIAEELELEIYAATGALILSDTWNIRVNKSYILQLWVPGVYSLCLRYKNQIIGFHKLIVY
jgi:hypothetical protein